MCKGLIWKENAGSLVRHDSKIFPEGQMQQLATNSQAPEDPQAKHTARPWVLLHEAASKWEFSWRNPSTALSPPLRTPHILIGFRV